MNILLVEDSDEVSCITVEYLHELGHEVVAVAEAEIAIAQLKNTAFDAVMTDIRLPGMSGIELARAMLKDYPNIPVVIASGYGALNVEFLLGEKLPTVLMLPKPYDLPDLERTLREAAAIAQRSQELLAPGKLTSLREMVSPDERGPAHPVFARRRITNDAQCAAPRRSLRGGFRRIVRRERRLFRIGRIRNIFVSHGSLLIALHL